MNMHPFRFAGALLEALPSGALHWPDQRLLVVSDLHLGKSARLSAVGGAQLPPYETRETLARLSSDLEATGAVRVICLGDSFDAPDVETALPEDDLLWLSRMMAGRDWTWIEGNHDPGPVALGGAHRAALRLGPLVFRHIATEPGGEVSGHYHPKARLAARGRVLSRPCFLVDEGRLILPAFGAYTGGLCTRSAVLSGLMGENALAILTGARPVAIPMPRAEAG
ncbi:ligase-associated DNA damage response endonuclease PdeM [Thetidibacter halocola]|uniref:Ligase-associated DNA damage response endonuclease PdeM n=1 Tax=Thetidibacter halocola TaxID=2827239 RepID=A0A8J7WI03_9RHOB|nr:ligase-associated DNA damage response endonuclease PdeM [Thetidibacter halocola]MBS0125473.1 ligase-associated DNA damage response endonuclease PdeM [Thetidibacter halocola]